METCWLHFGCLEVVGHGLRLGGWILELGGWIWEVWGAPAEATRGVPGFWVRFVGRLGGGRWGAWKVWNPTSHSLVAPTRGAGGYQLCIIYIYIYIYIILYHLYIIYISFVYHLYIMFVSFLYRFYIMCYIIFYHV